MTLILGASSVIYNLGTLVLTVLLIFIFGLVFKLGFNRAIRGAFTIGAVYFISVLLTSRLTSDFPSIATAFADRFGLVGDIEGVSYSVLASFVSSKMLLLMIPLGILINILLLVTGSIRTINIDLTSFWNMAFTGFLVQYITDSAFFGYFAAMLHIYASLMLADMTSFRVERSTLLPGTTVTHGFITAFAPVAVLINAFLDLFPIIRNKDLTFPYLKKKIGILGEPSFWCMLAAITMAILAGRDVYGVITLGVTYAVLAAVFPVLSAFFRDSFGRLAEKMHKKLNEGTKKGRISIGFGAFLALMNPTAVFVSLLLVVFTMVLGSLNFFSFVPTADIYFICYIAAACVLYSKGGILRSLLSGMVSVTIMLLCGKYLAPSVTSLAESVDAETYANVYLVNAVAGGSNPLTSVLTFGSSYGLAGAAALVLIAAIVFVLNRDRIAKEHTQTLAKHGETVYPLPGDMRHLSFFVQKRLAHMQEENHEKQVAKKNGGTLFDVDYTKPEKKSKKQAENAKKETEPAKQEELARGDLEEILTEDNVRESERKARAVRAAMKGTKTEDKAEAAPSEEVPAEEKATEEPKEKTMDESVAGIFDRILSGVHQTIDNTIEPKTKKLSEETVNALQAFEDSVTTLDNFYAKTNRVLSDKTMEVLEDAVGTEDANRPKRKYTKHDDAVAEGSEEKKD